jgi:hypothetical protein
MEYRARQTPEDVLLLLSSTVEETFSQGLKMAVPNLIESSLSAQDVARALSCFPRDIADLIYSMRDRRMEEVGEMGGTPSRLCFDTDCKFGQVKPHIWTDLPTTQIESDEEASDYGEMWTSSDLYASIKVRDIAITRTIMLRSLSGRGRPAKFRRLQKQNDRCVKQMYFQCESCL